MSKSVTSKSQATSKSKEPGDRALSIPPPRADRPPLHANLFAAMQTGNTQLMPLFPHLYPGAMVPAGAILRGGPDKDHGHFFHHNTVDEVVVAFAANGSLLKTGQVFVGGRVHGVNSFLKDEKNPESFAIMCITQRQAEDGPQHEAVSLQCEACREEVFRYEYDATPQPDADTISHPFPSLTIPAKAMADYNSKTANRTCPKCGHVNAPFPLRDWGWEAYVDQSATVHDGVDALRDAAGQLSSD